MNKFGTQHSHTADLVHITHDTIVIICIIYH